MIAGWAYLTAYSMVDYLLIKLEFQIPTKIKLLSIYNHSPFSVISCLAIAAIVFFMVYTRAKRIDKKYAKTTKDREVLLSP